MKKSQEKAKEAAQNAILLEDVITNPGAHYSLASSYIHLGRVDSAKY